jgi:predicted TIM-barrel fold metal-dependent hydrolase
VPVEGWDCHVHVFDARAVTGSHYRPVPRPLADIDPLARSHGFRHLVLVQPSVYGTDNALLLESLRSRPGRHRGVVVLRGDEDAGALDAMHDAGVRGARFNLVSPVGSTRDEVPALLQRLAPGIRARGWHVQWYAAPGDLARLVQLQQACGLTFVLDHLAGMTAAQLHDAAAWRSLRELAAAGAWIKLSGWYRLRSVAPYSELLPVVRQVADTFGGRMVWGSDWPHTSFAPDARPAYESVWPPVIQALGASGAGAVAHAGDVLYA